MSTKGLHQSLATRTKISLAIQKDRTIIDFWIADYIKRLQSGSFPTVTDCAIHAKISEKTLIMYELSTPENSEVRQALELIRDMQKSALIHGGLEGKYDSKITSLLLMVNHNMKPEAPSLTQNNTFNVSPEILAEAITLTRAKKPDQPQK